MKKTAKLKKLSGFFIAFLVVALAFLAVGLGTLGSFYSTGEAFLLTASQGDNDESKVEFHVTNPKDADGNTLKDEDGNTLTLTVVEVYVNVAVIHAEEGVPATLQLRRRMASTSYSGSVTATLENFYTPETDANGKTVTTTGKDVFFRYVMPFTSKSDPAKSGILANNSSGWTVSSYPYIELTVTGNVNVLINEIVFVGKRTGTVNDETAPRYVVPVEIHSATPYADESEEEAILRAGALIDAQPAEAPVDQQTSFSRFTKEEVASLMTIAEMKQGRVFEESSVDSVYYADNVFGAFGTDFLALGTAIFGLSPFGLRIFPMLAAFGALVVLSRFVTRLAKSEKAGLVFAVLFALSCFTMGLAHVGTPFMIGIFFLACALDFTHRFYAKGIKGTNFVSVLPLLFAGLFSAAAICVHGAFVIPVAGVALLFVCGMLRQQTAKRYQLEKIAAEAEGEQPAPEGERAEAATEAAETPELRAGKVMAEYRFKNTAAPVLFAAGLIVGAFLFALIGMIPAYYTYQRVFDNPVNPTLTVFQLAWQTFANGFVGSNPYAGGNGFSIFYNVFTGTGDMYAITAIAVNWIAILAGVAGLVLAIVRLVLLTLKKADNKTFRAEIRRTLIPLVGLCLSLVAAVVAGNAVGFVALGWLFAFMLTANGAGATYEGKVKTAVKAVNIAGLVLLVIVFGLLAVFTFSVPLPATFLATIF